MVRSMSKKIRFFTSSIFASILMSTLSMFAVLAQSNLLTEAEIYKLVERVQIVQKDSQPRSAKIKDEIQPMDAVRTASKSRADLLFNEGSLVRLGGNALFRFTPGTRNFQLNNGTGLFMFVPGQQGGTVVTPEANIATAGSTIWVQHNSGQKTTFVGVLTDNLSQPVTVSNQQGDGTISLKAGQRIAVAEGKVEPPQEMNLNHFYQVCKLAADLTPGQESLDPSVPPQVQKTISVVRSQATAAMMTQAQTMDSSTEPISQAKPPVPCTPEKEPPME